MYYVHSRETINRECLILTRNDFGTSTYTPISVSKSVGKPNCYKNMGRTALLKNY